MSTSDDVRKEIESLKKETSDLLELAKDTEDTMKFGREYQKWYSRAYKVVESLRL